MNSRFWTVMTLVTYSCSVQFQNVREMNVETAVLISVSFKERITADSSLLLFSWTWS